MRFRATNVWNLIQSKEIQRAFSWNADCSTSIQTKSFPYFHVQWMILLYYKHADPHTDTQKRGGMFFPRAFPLGTSKASDDLLIPSVSICVISKILERKLWPFNVKGVEWRRYEWKNLVKHQTTDELPKSVCWRWKAIANLFARFVASVNLQFFLAVKFALPSPELSCFHPWSQISAAIQSVT